ncbi:MAG TPA: CxxxxCH/CxxCH domain-containing protein [Anaeromyxobacter sp.]
MLKTLRRAYGDRCDPPARSTRWSAALAAALAAVLATAGCGSRSKAADPAPTPGRSAQALATATATANHDYFATQGIDCATCHACGSSPTHGTDWMDQASTGFHAYTANQGLSACQGCHGTGLDGVGGLTAVACAMCHGAGWNTNCTMCHGDVADGTGAPPKTTWGNGADAVRVGAHRSHVNAANNVALPIACTTCHPAHRDALEPGHIAGTTAVLKFDALATPPVGPAPVWDRTTATCATTYCHGATLNGGTLTKPTWTTVDGSQEACGTCHGYPPYTGRHLQHVVSYGLRCWVCHQRVAPAQFTPALHVNGRPDLDPSPTANSFGGFSDWKASATGPGTLMGTSTGCHGGIYYWTGMPPRGRNGCW